MTDPRAGENVADLAQLIAEEIDNECLGLDADRLERATAAALRGIKAHEVQWHQEWVRRNFLGSASSITEADPSQQAWNAPSQSVKEARHG